MRNREYWRNRAKDAVLELSDQNSDMLRPIIKSKIVKLISADDRPTIGAITDGDLAEFVFWLENEAHKLATGEPLYTKPRFLVPAGSERAS